MPPEIDETHQTELRSCVSSANDLESDFPIQNLPFGIYRRRGKEGRARGGVAIGDCILDLRSAVDRGWFEGKAERAARAASRSRLNEFLTLGPESWSVLRLALSKLLREGSAPADIHDALVMQRDAEMLVPVDVGDFTDFAASYDHAFNSGSLVRPDQPIFPNYFHLPIGYHGRSSSIQISGTPCMRPWGQTPPSSANAAATFEPSKRLDYELELGALVAGWAPRTPRLPLADAGRQLFGFVLLNDWSARDIQRWESTPLGPFLAKSFLTTISPWIVTSAALAPFRTRRRVRQQDAPPLLPFLEDPTDSAHGAFNITVSAAICSAEMRHKGFPAFTVSRGNSQNLYWSFAQLLTHHASNGSVFRSGDIIGSGTISSSDRRSSGCLMEVTANAHEPISLPSGEMRGYLEDGDEVIFTGRCVQEGARPIGFGECRGVVTSSTAAAQ